MEKNFKWWFELATVIVVFVIGLLGNILVLFVILHQKTGRKTIHGVFVTSLAIADLVLLCFDSSYALVTKINKPLSGRFICRFSSAVVTAGYNAGLFTITSMAIHRCYVVTNPLMPKLKRRGVFIWVSLIWLTAFILVIPIIVVNKPAEKGCQEDWPSFSLRQAYTASLMTVQYILPLLITATCYIRIWLFLRRRPVMPRNSGLTGSRGEAPAEGENNRESIVILKTVAVITLLFLIMLLPTQIAWMLKDFRNISNDELWFASHILTRVHSCLNPVVYGVMNKQYRRSYVKFLLRIFSCNCHTRVESELRNHMTNRNIHNSEMSGTIQNRMVMDINVSNCA